MDVGTAGVGGLEGSAGVRPISASDRGSSGEHEGGDGGSGAGTVVSSQALTSDDFQCNICWELLAR